MKEDEKPLQLPDRHMEFAPIDGNKLSDNEEFDHSDDDEVSQDDL